jgi:hypothetical protein
MSTDKRRRTVCVSLGSVEDLYHQIEIVGDHAAAVKLAVEIVENLPPPNRQALRRAVGQLLAVVDGLLDEVETAEAKSQTVRRWLRTHIQKCRVDRPESARPSKRGRG